MMVRIKVLNQTKKGKKLELAFTYCTFSTKQELQRRLDQTLGKPGSYLTGIDRVGNVRPMTVGARLYRVEQHMSNLDKKLDQIMHAINGMAHQKMISSSSSTQPLILPAGPSQAPSPIPLRCLEDDV